MSVFDCIYFAYDKCITLVLGDASTTAAFRCLFWGFWLWYLYSCPLKVAGDVKPRTVGFEVFCRELIMSLLSVAVVFFGRPVRGLDFLSPVVSFFVRTFQIVVLFRLCAMLWSITPLGTPGLKKTPVSHMCQYIWSSFNPWDALPVFDWLEEHSRSLP